MIPDIKRGIIVSKNGYTPDAQKYAKHHNILIVQLREAGKEYPEQYRELHLFDLGINIGINRRRPVVTNIIVKDIDNNKITLQEKDQYSISIENVDGKKSSLFDVIMVFKDYLHQQNPDVEITKEYSYSQSLLRSLGKTHTIDSITFTGQLTVSNTNERKEFSIVDRVWLLMEKIFEQQTFIVTDGGIIVDTTAKKV